MEDNQMNVYKLIIDGKEYEIRDKQAQTVIESLTKRIEELENKPCQLYWVEVD